MYTRKLRIKLRTDTVQEFRYLLEHKVIPLLRAQKGFQDEITLVASDRNEAIAISFWNNQEDADAYNHIAYLDVLRVLSKVVESLPIVETFDISDSTLHKPVASTA
jgi:hypothetical protein